MPDKITSRGLFDPDSNISVRPGFQNTLTQGKVEMPESTLDPLDYWGDRFILDGKIYYRDKIYLGLRLGPWWQFGSNVILNNDPVSFDDCVVDPFTGECFGDMTTIDTGESVVVRQGLYYAGGVGVDIPLYRILDLGLAVYGERDNGNYGNSENPKVLYRATDLTKPRPEYDVLQEYERWGVDAEISARFKTKFIDVRVGGGRSWGKESTESTNEGIQDTQSGASHRWHFGLGLEFHAARDGIVPKQKPRAVISSSMPPAPQPEQHAPAVLTPVPKPEVASVVQESTRLPEPEAQPEPPIPQQMQPEELAEFPEPELPAQEIPPPEPIEEEVVVDTELLPVLPEPPMPIEVEREPEVQNSSIGGGSAVYILDGPITKGRGGGMSDYGATSLELELCTDCALPKVMSGALTIDGDLDETDIEMTLRPYMENISNCYNIPRELVNRPIEDMVTIKFVINPNGQVDDVHVSFLYMDPRNPHSGLNVENFRNIFSSLEFPRPRDGSSVTVAYPFDFSFYPEPGYEVEPQEMEERTPAPVELDFEAEAK